MMHESFPFCRSVQTFQGKKRKRMPHKQKQKDLDAQSHVFEL